MAQLVLAVGSSHGPSIQMQPEDWPKLGEKDTRDPRFSFEALLSTAKPGLEQEITPEIQRQRHAASHAALDKLTGIIAGAKLDVVIVVSNTHAIAKNLSRPVFGVLCSATIPVQARGEKAYIPGSLGPNVADAPADLTLKPGQPDLANHLLECLIDEEFDVACVERLADGVALDDAFSFCYEWLLADADLPLLPFMLSRDLPNQASPARCLALGKALRRAIEAWPGDSRVGLIASGGLSHQVIDEPLDQAVIQALTSGDEATLSGFSRAQLNRAPGTPEILNWITVAAAMAPTTMTLVDYLPCYRSLAGTGHGITFGVWQ
ncbi:MAG: hypothetical protein ACI82H_000140 [Alphaproteobacteria bacterium]|jgi:hypothetical protein